MYVFMQIFAMVEYSTASSHMNLLRENTKKADILELGPMFLYEFR